MNNFAIGDKVWVSHTEHAWLCGKISKIDATTIDIGTEIGKVSVKAAQFSSLEPCGSHIDDNVENLVDLDELSEVIICYFYYVVDNFTM